jgi:hypothetical protein
MLGFARLNPTYWFGNKSGVGWIGDFRIRLQGQKDEVPKPAQFQGAADLGIANPTIAVVLGFAWLNPPT